MSDSLSRVSREADGFFVRLLLAADEFGRLDGRPSVLLGQTYSARGDTSTDDIERWLRELESSDGDAGPVLRYVVRGRPYVQLVNWERHRGKSKRGDVSRMPGPDEADPRVSADVRGELRQPADVRGSGSGSVSGSGSGCGSETQTAEAAEPEARLSQPAMFDPEPATAQTPQQAAQAAREAAQAALPKLDDEHRPLLNLISKQPGSPREKELWLIEEAEGLLLEAKGDTAELRRLVYRWYKAYLRRPTLVHAGRPMRKLERAERREAEDVAFAAHTARNRADPAVQARIAELERERLKPMPAMAGWDTTGNAILEAVGRGR